MVVTLGPDFEPRMAELDQLTSRMEALATECVRLSEQLLPSEGDDLDAAA